MTDYYFSNHGNDGSDGQSVDTAWQTLAQAAGISLQPGDRLLLEAGSVWEEPLHLYGAGTLELPVIVTSYGTGRPRLRWHQGAVVDIHNASHLVIRGLEIECSSAETLYPALRGVDDPAQVQEAPKRFRDGTNTGIRAHYEGEGVFDGLVIEDNWIVGRGVDQSSEGILVTAALPPRAFQPKFRRLVIRNNIVEQLGWRGIGTEGPHQVFDPQNIPWMAFEDVTVEGNIARKIGVQGICVFNAHQVHMLRNLVDRAGQYQGVGVTWGPAGLWPWSCADVLIEYNEVTGMLNSNSGADATGIDIDWSSQHVVVRHNHCYDNQGNGIVTMACRDSLISQNRLEGNLCKVNLGTGQIGLCDYQTEQVAEAITGITNLEIRENLVRLDRDNVCALSTVKISAGKDWENVSFRNNRLIFMDRAQGLCAYDLARDAPVHLFAQNDFYGLSSDGFLARQAGEDQDWQAWSELGNDAGARFLPLDTTAPSPVDGLQAAYQEDKVHLSWEPSQDSRSGVHHYNIYRGISPGFMPRYLSLIGVSRASEFEDLEEPLPGVYWYKVEAEDACGNTSGHLGSTSVHIPES